MAAEAPKMARDGTMEATAKEGIAFLEKQKPALAEDLKKLKEDVEQKENGSGDAPAEHANGTTPKVPRDNTMVQTAEEGKKFLEKEGGVNEDAKTRGQEKELNDSKTEEKEATKRSADDKTETDEAKKQKVEEEENGKEEADKEEAKE